jgi:hypothetical protein
MKWLRRLSAGLAVLGVVGTLRGMLTNPLTADPKAVAEQVQLAVTAVEQAEGINLPEELVRALVAADLAIVQDWYAGQKKA